ncbi:MAG: HYR domain-containing protein, partial [Thiohalobacterales bacterium]|nr:HYR domain-containing protein [Thiohalobacterales bacterium]
MLNRLLPSLLLMLRLRSGPQDLPASWSLAGVLLATSFGLGMYIGQTLGGENAVARSLAINMLQVIAVVDEPYKFADDATMIVSQAPVVSVIAEGGAVNEACTDTVVFSGEAFDDCGLDSADVAVNVSLLDGDAGLGDVSLAVTPTDTSVVFSGSVVVSLNDGLPASILVEVSATDNCDRVTMVADTAEVFDDTPPEITCPGNVIVECTSFGGTPATDPQLRDFFDGVGAVDNCSEPTIEDNAPDFFELGTTVVVFTATDAAGNAAACSASVEVVDTTPPNIALELNRYWLWPPNHKFHDIVAAVTVD